MDWSVGEVARYAGVSVRTLHHYDEIGLLRPGGRSRAGYRRYAGPDLERLQQILAYRELGFPLDEIAALLDDPDADAVVHLRRQRELLMQRIDRLRAMVGAVERALEAHKMGMTLSPEERFEVFGEHDPAQYAEEVERRWGDTDAYAQSRQRTGRYTKQDWLRIRAEAEEIEGRLASALRDGLDPTSGPVLDLAEEHRRHIDTWFYDCGYPMHRCLGEMYLADERFRVRYDGIAPGLARFVRDAIAANAARAGH